MSAAEQMLRARIETTRDSGARHRPDHLTSYERWFEVRWADVDQNAHMRHTAYLDYATQARMDCFRDCGASLRDFQAALCGPILLRESARYLREIAPEQDIVVRVELSGASADGRYFAMRSAIHRSDGELAAVIDVHGAWLHTQRRRLMSAPDWLDAAMARMPRAADYALIGAAA